MGRRARRTGSPLPPPAEPARPEPLAPSRPEGVELGAGAGRRLAAGRARRRRVTGSAAAGCCTRCCSTCRTCRTRIGRGGGARWLDRPGHGLPAGEAATLAAEVLAILAHPDLAPLFGPGSRAEVPLTG